MLARQGRLIDAAREFEMALKQAGGDFDDAAHNLKLCQALLASPAKGLVASTFVISGLGSAD
jgi:hypothetical protein